MRRSWAPLDTLAPFDLAFLDPPYRKGLLAPALTGLATGGWLNPHALVIAEDGGRRSDTFGGWI